MSSASASLNELNHAVKRLREAWRRLASSLEIRSNVGLYQRHRVVACAQDIIAFASIFSEAFHMAYAESLKDVVRIQGMTPEQFLEDRK